MSAVIRPGKALPAPATDDFYLVMRGGLDETRLHLRAMTDGDLTTRPDPRGHDEAAALMLSLRGMQDALHRIVVDVRGGSDQILTSSNEITAGALDLSARTEKTVVSLDQARQLAVRVARFQLQSGEAGRR